MKKIILLIGAIIFLCSTPLFSQCENQISTIPQNPYNSALPDLENSGIPYALDERYLNGFDWINGNHLPETKEYVLTGMMYNPEQPYGNMANIQDPNLSGYYSYLNKVNNNEEMNNENGWELMLINLGRFPDDVTPNNQTTLNVVPYLVFYNKYRGVLRVFVQYGYNEPPPNSVKGVKIDMYYDNLSPNVSGVFRLGEGFDRTLDQKTNVSKLSTFAPKIGQQVFWMSSDFQLAFDPCVCDFESNIKLDFTFFSEDELKLYGRAISVEDDLVDGTEVQDKGFLSIVDYSEGTGANGLIIYNRMEDLIDDYIIQLDAYKEKLESVGKHNEEVERNLKIAKAVSTVIKLGITFAVGTPEIIDLQGDLSKYFFSDNSAVGKKAVENLFKKMEELLGKGMETWISKNFKAKPQPEAPEAPTAVFTEMHFSGKLISNTPILGPRFNTPGSFVNHVDDQGQNTVLDLPVQSVYGYPVYNNPTGVFALLEKPKVAIADYFERDCSSIPNSNLSSYNLTSILQWKINNELKFVFNPALDIISYNMKVSIILKGDILGAINHNGEIGHVKNDPEYAVNVESTKFNIDNEEWYEKKEVEFESIFVPIDVFNNTTFSVGVNKDRTSIVPCGQGSWDPDGFFNLVYDTIFLKILLNVEFEGLNSNGEHNTGTYLFTYIVDNEDIDYSNTPLYPNLPGSIGDISQYQENLVFSNTTFDGSPIDGCKLNGNHYTCQAWNDVTISGVLTTANGYTVEIFAGNDIEQFPESEISPEIVLQINPILDYSNPLPEATPTYVSDFCNGLNPNAPIYSANTSSKNLFNDPNNLMQEPKQPFSFSLFPNPTTQQTTVKVNGEYADQVSIVVYDIAGKEQRVAISGEGGRFNLDVAHLAKGLYLVKVSTFGESQTKQLVIN